MLQRIAILAKEEEDNEASFRPTTNITARRRLSSYHRNDMIKVVTKNNTNYIVYSTSTMITRRRLSYHRNDKEKMNK